MLPQLHRPAARPVLALLAAGALLSACGGSSTASPAPPNAPPAATGGTSSGVADASLNYGGTFTEPATTPRPPAPGKSIVIISTGQASISSSIPVAAAKQAAEKLGWKVDVYDSKLDPSLAPGLVRQAVAAKADGIIIDAIDCPTVKSAMEEAKAAGIQMVGMYAFDCNDPIFPQSSPPLFSGTINYGADNQANLGAFTEKYGADQAKAVIASTGGKAKVLFFNDQEVTVLRYTGKGFLDEMKKCSGCQVLEQVNFTGSELGPNLQAKVTTTLLKHPDANAVKSPFTAATLLGIQPAVQQAGKANSLYVMGGEGFEPELNLLRAGTGVSAVMITPSDWTGYAAVDTMNSLFTKMPIAASGLGWQLVDKTHNLPASGSFEPKVDFKAAYAKAWGK